MFKRKKKKTGCETPELRQYTPPPPPPTSGSNAVKPNPNYVPTATVPLQKTMYGLNLYIPFEDLDTYIHAHIDKNYGDCHFIPVKVGINEVDLSIEIKLLSASTAEIDNNRYKLDFNLLTKEDKKCKD
jgi:hypothetical protein